MSKIAIITDTHFGARGDSLPLQRSQQRFFDDVFFPTLDKHGVRTVLHGGDYGDRRKYINFVTASFITKQYRGKLREREIEEFAIVGNHDTFYKHTNEVNSIQELYYDDDSLVIIKDPVELTIEGVPFLLLPWICDDNRERSMELLEKSRATCVLGHLEVSGFQMYRGQPSAQGLDPSLFDRFRLVMSGHFHHKSNRGPIHYLGAPYPMTWQDYRDPRGFHLFDTEHYTLEFVENPYSIFARIVYDDADQKHDYINHLCQSILADDSKYREAYVKVVVKNKTQPYWFDLMMDSLYKVNALDVVVVDDIVVNEDESETETIPTDVDTLTLIAEYIDSLSINCDKGELNDYLRAIYNEALTANQSARLS